MRDIAVIGAGSWGTALSVHLARLGHGVRLWAREAELVAQIRRDRVNGLFLPGIPLPESIVACEALDEAVAGMDLVVVVTPSHGTRAARESRRAAPSPVSGHRQRDEGPRGGHASPRDGSDPTGGGARASGRRAFGAELRPRSGARAADGGVRRLGGSRRRRAGAIGVQGPLVPPLHDGRRRGRRDRSGAEERDRDRRRRRRGAWPRPQRDGRPDHARARRDLASGARARRPPGDARRVDRPRRPGADVHRRSQPQPPVRHRVGARAQRERHPLRRCRWWPKA